MLRAHAGQAHYLLNATKQKETLPHFGRRKAFHILRFSWRQKCWFFFFICCYHTHLVYTHKYPCVYCVDVCLCMLRSSYLFFFIFHCRRDIELNGRAGERDKAKTDGTGQKGKKLLKLLKHKVGFCLFKLKTKSLCHIKVFVINFAGEHTHTHTMQKLSHSWMV